MGLHTSVLNFPRCGGSKLRDCILEMLDYNLSWDPLYSECLFLVCLGTFVASTSIRQRALFSKGFPVY